uniref:TRAP-type C4-dicarboxylate transport system, periplasmic component n=1 Tax=Haliea sp. ETY-M TaxID=1055105 RepID=A0A455R723_9GAMM|nr:TRAP-type C4-dicarboxylate transport system, periplasmic component [Haliea sp. ETY-M]
MGYVSGSRDAGGSPRRTHPQPTVGHIGGPVAVVVAIALWLVLGAAGARAEQALRLGFALAQGSPHDTFAETFREELGRLTAGSLQVENYCCFKLGGDQELVRKLQLGTLDATIVAQNNVGPFFPKIDLLSLPYILRDHEHAVRVLDGPVGQQLWGDMPEVAGVHVITIAYIAFRHIFNTQRPIATQADFEQLKYRVPRNAVMVDTYKAFGADPVPLAWSETLTAVQTGTVDGGDLPVDVIYSQRFHEVAKHLALTGHFAMTPAFLVSDRFMRGLSASEHTAVYAAARVAAAAARAQVTSREATILDVLASDHGVGITRPDKTPFIAAASTVKQTFAAQRGSEYDALIKAIHDVE